MGPAVAGGRAGQVAFCLVTERLGERDILRLGMLADPQLSPDGSQVAFVLIEQDASASGDLRTPLEQAENVFARLHKMGKEVDLLVFSGVPHAIVVQGKPWNRVRHMKAILAWFDRYVQPAREAVPAR